MGWTNRNQQAEFSRKHFSPEVLLSCPCSAQVTLESLSHCAPTIPAAKMSARVKPLHSP